MRHSLVVVALASSFAALSFAAEPAGPACADYIGMGDHGRMASMETMREAMGAMMGGAGGMMMKPGEMMEHASAACAAHPGGTVGEAMEMMTPSE